MVKSALALMTAFLATACMQENFNPEKDGSTVTFTVAVPEAVATKAAVVENGENINNLVYAVYRTTEESSENAIKNLNPELFVYGVNPVAEGETTFFADNKTTISLELINNQKYVVLFWAQVDQTWVEGEINENSLTSISYPETETKKLVANDSKYAAFSGVAFVEEVKGSRKESVTLTRPFAQINLATNNPERYGVDVTASSVTIENAAATFNVATQQASGKRTVEYKSATNPDGKFNGYDHYVAMNYIFANPKGENSEIVSVTCVMDTKEHGEGIEKVITNVPVAQNYKTNIVGNLLTSDVEYTVTLEKGWGGADLAPDALYLAAAIGGEVTLSEDVVLTSPLEVNSKMTINLNGKTIKGEYNKSVGAIIKNNGLLTISGGIISSLGNNGGSAIANYGTLYVENAEINGAPREGNSWPGYPINNYGSMTLTNTTVAGYHGCVALNAAGTTVLNNCNLTKNYGTTSSHVFYVDHADAKVEVNGGTYNHNGNDGSLAYVNKGEVIINDGTFNTTDGGYGFAVLTNGKVTVNGGNINAALQDWGGEFMINGGVFSSKPADKYIANGYKAIKKDGKYYVVTDNTFSSSDEFNTAIENAAEGDKIMLLDGTYTIDNYKAGVTIIGAGENVTLDIQDKIYDVNGTATIENVKVVFSNNGYKGFQGGVDLNFKECTIEGQPFLYGTKATFEGCTFVQNDPEQYNIWTYAVLEANFIDCVFNCAGKSVLVYSEANDLVQKVNFEGCTFSASTPYNGKAAIEIGTLQLTTGMYNVTINDTDVNNFANGSVSGNPVWNVKNGNRANVIVDGEVCTVGGADMVSDGLWKSGTTYSVTNAEGLASINSRMANKTAGKGITINLLSDIDFTGKTWTPVDSHADTAFEIDEINGNGHTISNLTIEGQAMFTRFAGSDDVVVKDITFDNATVNSNGNINTSILTVQTYQNVLLDNVDVKNSSITGGYKVAPLIGTVYNESSTTITATLKNCDVENVTVKATTYDFCTTGMVAFVNAGDNDDIKFENCTVKNVMLYAPNVYTAHAAIYTTGSETLFNEAEGVTVTNVTFENI